MKLDNQRKGNICIYIVSFLLTNPFFYIQPWRMLLIKIVLYICEKSFNQFLWENLCSHISVESQQIPFVCYPHIEFLFVIFPFCAYKCGEFPFCWSSVRLFSFPSLFRRVVFPSGKQNQSGEIPNQARRSELKASSRREYHISIRLSRGRF